MTVSNIGSASRFPETDFRAMPTRSWTVGSTLKLAAFAVFGLVSLQLISEKVTAKFAASENESVNTAVVHIDTRGADAAAIADLHQAASRLTKPVAREASIGKALALLDDGYRAHLAGDKVGAYNCYVQGAKVCKNVIASRLKSRVNKADRERLSNALARFGDKLQPELFEMMLDPLDPRSSSIEQIVGSNAPDMNGSLRQLASQVRLAGCLNPMNLDDGQIGAIDTNSHFTEGTRQQAPSQSDDAVQKSPVLHGNQRLISALERLENGF